MTTGATTGATTAGADYNKVLSLSSRFKPSEIINFEQPIIGLNGNMLISYQWAYEWSFKENHEGELVNKRISDWTQAETSAETGRDIVHKFTIKRKDGVEVVVSSETVPVLLGYVNKEQYSSFLSMATAVKTLAKQRMKYAILKAQQQEYDNIRKELELSDKPEITLAEDKDLPFVHRLAKEKGDNSFQERYTYFKMGDKNTVSQFGANAQYPNEKTKEQLEDNWVQKELKKRGVKPPYGIYDLERRIERQEKRVKNLFNSEITLTNKE